MTTPDLRLPEHRRDTFQRFYAFHTTHRTHPGLVWGIIPWLAAHRSWTEEQAAWFCFLNGNTQNPVTSLLIFDAAPGPWHAVDAVRFWRANYDRLAWDTDRRYHRRSFDVAVYGYLAALPAAPWVTNPQVRFWRSHDSWRSLWAAASALPTFGRLSTWSYLEYLFIAGLHDHDADTLLLDDRDGSRSHRNGLCIVDGLDHLDWHASNPAGFDGRYTPDVLDHLGEVGESLLDEARRRSPGDRSVTRLTLESALCTYKSWHRPRRRYPNVYADMHHDRVRAAERAFPGVDFSVWWEMRRDLLPARLRLESNPYDPGVSAPKQNHYRETGEVIMMEVEWPETADNGFARAVRAQVFGRRR